MLDGWLRRDGLWGRRRGCSHAVSNSGRRSRCGLFWCLWSGFGGSAGLSRPDLNLRLDVVHHPLDLANALGALQVLNPLVEQLLVGLVQEVRQGLNDLRSPTLSTSAANKLSIHRRSCGVSCNVGNKLRSRQSIARIGKDGLKLLPGSLICGVGDDRINCLTQRCRSAVFLQQTVGAEHCLQSIRLDYLNGGLIQRRKQVRVLFLEDVKRLVSDCFGQFRRLSIQDNGIAVSGVVAVWSGNEVAVCVSLSRSREVG